MSASSWVSSRDGSLRAFPTVNPLVTDANDDWSPEGFEPEASPARKFVAGPDWIAVGDLVLQPGDQIEAHLDLDSRASAAVADGSLTAGFLYGDSERVHLKAFPGPPLTERARSELDAWARAEGIEVHESQTKGPRRLF
jgi:hypothetical protein